MYCLTTHRLNVLVACLITGFRVCVSYPSFFRVLQVISTSLMKVDDMMSILT